jgi:hypothetical protein
MLLWLPFLIGLGVILGTSGLVLAMGRAERRARRTLYRLLGLTETTVDFLMERNRNVLAELTHVRDKGEGAIGEAVEGAAPRDRKVIFLRPGTRIGPFESSPGAVPTEPPQGSFPSPSSSDGHTRH